MSKKKKIIKSIETYINEQKKEEISSIFGNNCNFTIQDIDYSDRLKTTMIQAKITFGEDFDEYLLNFTSLFDIILGEFIRDVIDCLEPDTKIVLTISYDI